MNIRTYKKSDFPIVEQIYALSKLDELLYEKNEFTLIPLSSDEKRCSDFMASCIYIVELDSYVVGFLGYRDNHISWLFVHPMYRRKGIGKSMIEFIKSKLKNDITLHVAASNAPAVSLYKRQGFRKSKELIGEYNAIPVNVIEMSYCDDR